MRALPHPFSLFLALAASGGSARAQGAAPLRTGPPAWAQDAVWYVVQPDRFRNGDPRNDPKVADLRGAWPYDVPRDWRLSPWTADWYKLQPWEKATGRTFYEVAPMRRFGGDLQGILERLDHIQGLGVTALVLNPIFEAPSASRRDTAALHHVDNNLGPEPDGDRLIWATENPADPGTWKWTAADRLLLRLIQECHRRQIKLVLEGVFDHVGTTFWAFRDLRAKGRSSRLAGWFAVRAFDDPKTPQDELDYAMAEGVREWPELRRHGDGLAAGPRDHLRAIVRRWGDPNGDGDPADGVDGWRVPAADRLPKGFLRELRRWVLGWNPEGLIVGSVGREAAGSEPTKGRVALKGDELDAVVSDGWASAVKAFFVDRQGAIPASELDARLAALRAETTPDAGLAALHPAEGDRGPRLSSLIVNPDRPDGVDAGPRLEPQYDVRGPRPEEWRRLRLVATFQYASPGAPVLRYGTESGMWGAAEPDNEKPMLWKDLAFEPEATHPLDQPRKAEAGRFDDALLKFFQGLGQLRAAQPALRRGSFETVLVDDARRVFAFARVLETDRVIAAFNASDKEATLDLPAPAPAVRDLLTGRRMKARDEKVQVAVPGLGAVYLVGER